MEINRELKLTITLVTHEMDVIRRVCDQVVVMDGSAIVEQGDVIDVFLHPQHLTTRRFMSEAERADEDERHDDFTRVSGLILRLTFRDEATYVSLLGAVAWQIGVNHSIFFGHIDHIEDTPYGQLTLTLVGGDPEVAMS